MPLYDFECDECGSIKEHYAGLDDKRMPCECGGTARRLITSRYYVNPDVDFVTDNITGDPVRVDSRVKLRRLLAENGLYERYGKGWQ